MKLKIETQDTATFVPVICVIGDSADSIKTTERFMRIVTGGRRIETSNNPFEADVVFASKESLLAPFIGMNNTHDPRTKLFAINEGTHALPSGIKRLAIRNGAQKIREEIFSPASLAN